MKTVGIKNLKNSLSQYINLVKSGESILITEHDKIVAEIIPSPGRRAESGLLENYLSEQEKYGAIIRAKKKSTLKKANDKQSINEALLQKIYNETRADRS